MSTRQYRLFLYFFIISFLLPSLSFSQNADPFSNITGIANYSTGYGLYYERFLGPKWSLGGDVAYWYYYEKEGTLSIMGTYYPIGNIFRLLVGFGPFGAYASKGGYDSGFSDGISGSAKLSLGGAYFPASEPIQIKLFGDMYFPGMFTGSTILYFKPGFSVGYRF